MRRTARLGKGIAMRLKSEKAQFDLRAQEIDRLSQWLEALLSALAVRREDRIRIRLLTEELLLRMRERFGEETPVEAYLESAFGRPVFRMELAGEAFNPLRETGSSLGDWNDALITAVKIAPRYTYSWGRNVLRFPVPRKTVSHAAQIVSAITLGVAFGVLGTLFLPDGARDYVAGTLFSPLFGVWVRILNAMSGPVIFLMAVTTMLSTKQITRQGGTKLYVIARYFLLSCLIAGCTLVCALPFVGPGNLLPQTGTGALRELPDALLQIFPNNILQPFAESNTPQLLLLAFVIGGAMIALGSRVSRLKTVIRQINMIGLQLAKWISLLVPAFTCIFLTLECWQGQTALLRQIWKPFLLALGVSALVLCAALAWLSVRVKASPLVLFPKLFGAFSRILRSGAADSDFDAAHRACTNALGIDSSFAGLSLPQGMVLYTPVSSVGVLAFTLYAAFVYGVHPGYAAMIGAIILSVILFVETPPVPGANLLAYIVLFSILGLPDAALVDAMLFDIVFGIFAAACNQTLLRIELVLQAKRIGLLDLPRLRRAGAGKNRNNG